ncbi:hypothetical protein XI25_06825 [Paenibacillus sp. DMB20]|nr:hypothetical protein XI25_06825 [Paenibacillus sp. DMB20]
MNVKNSLGCAKSDRLSLKYMTEQLAQVTKENKCAKSGRPALMYVKAEKFSPKCTEISGTVDNTSKTKGGGHSHVQKCADCPSSFLD